MDLGLRGKTCIITGASRGIGFEAARILAQEGTDLALIARGKDHLESAVTELRALGVRAFAVPADMSVEREVAQGIKRAVSLLGRIDILVNNAGATKVGTFDAISDEQWFHSFTMKPMGYIRAIRGVLPHMRAQKRGRIVNVVGGAGRWAIAEYANAGVNACTLHLTKSLAEHVGPEGISVVAVNPGATGPTDKFESSFAVWAERAGVDLPVFIQRYLDTIPLRRIAAPEEIARLIAIMASDVAEYATGSALELDGGITRGVF